MSYHDKRSHCLFCKFQHFNHFLFCFNGALYKCDIYAFALITYCTILKPLCKVGRKVPRSNLEAWHKLDFGMSGDSRPLLYGYCAVQAYFVIDREKSFCDVVICIWTLHCKFEYFVRAAYFPGLKPKLGFYLLNSLLNPPSNFHCLRWLSSHDW